MSDRHDLKNAATAHGKAVLALIDALGAARQRQFEKPPGASILTRDGTHADPTGATATNTRHLRLRAATLNGLAELAHSTTALETARANIATALEQFLNPHGDLLAE